YHAGNGTCRNRDTKYSGQDLMGSFDADCANCIQGHSQCLEVFSVLYGCFYLRWKRTSTCVSMQHTNRDFQRLMLCHIYRDNGVNHMPLFGNTGSTFTHMIMRAAFTCSRHMLNDLIGIRYHSKGASRMPFLTTGFFTGRFTQALGSGFTQSVAGRWLGTVFGVLV